MKIFQTILCLSFISNILAANVLLNCGDSIDLADFSSSDEITILSHPGFDRSSRYKKNQDCQYNIEVASDGFSVSCDYFKVEVASGCVYDWLQFDNGADISSRYCGSGTLDFSSSSSNALDIQFSTDSSVQKKGFECIIQRRGGSSGPTSPPPSSTSPPTLSSSSPPTDCNCGQKLLGTRIVNGVETSINEYPWQVGLVTGSRPFCGGSLINSEWVLTAAHCLGGNFNIILGEHDVRTSTETVTVTRSTTTKIPHPNYSGNDYDYALVKLSSPIDFSDSANDHIRPVCLPTRNPPVGSVATITGWGTTSSGGSLSPFLQEANVNIVSNAQCSNDYGGGITSRMICAAAPGTDSCQGDSGGPMVSLNGNNWELVGVTSFGIGCANPNYPGVYARVFQSSILSWINGIIGSTSDCPPRS